MCFLDIWFYKERSISLARCMSPAIVNVFVTVVSPPFSHAELAFQDGLAVSVLMRHNVECRKRTFDPSYYTCLRLKVSQEVAVCAKHEALSRVGEPFSSTVYCSRLVWEILVNSKAVYAEETQGCLVNRNVTPSELYRRLLAAGAEEIVWLDVARPLLVDFKCEYIF